MLHNEERDSLYRSPNIVRVIKSRRLRWAGHVARKESRSAIKILRGTFTGNWIFYIGYYLEVSSSLLYVQELAH